MEVTRPNEPTRLARPPRRWLPRRRRGLTLLEMTMSLAILGVILAASTSLVMVTGKAARSGADGNVGAAATAARRATDQILDDLKVATAVTEQTATAVTMTVPDRDGDGAAETIRYAWSGTAGDPLYRTYNGVTGAVATDVRALSFSYLSKTAGKPPPVESAEVSHAAHAAASGTVGSNLTSNNFVAGYFKPTLSSKAVSWKVTRCRVQMSRASLSTGTITVALKYADAAKLPTGAALDSNTVLMVDVLGSAGWVDVSFPAQPALDVSKGVCVVVSYSALTGSGGSVYYDPANADAALAWTTSADTGATWAAASAASAMQFGVWGTVTTQERETLDFQALPSGP